VLTSELTTMGYGMTTGSHDLPGLRREVVRRVLSARRSRIRGGRVLNVGCDDGALESVFAAWGAIEIAAVDTDEKLIESLQARRPEFEYRAADLTHSMPEFLQGRSFDLVTAIGVLDPSIMDGGSFRQMLRNLCALCRPVGGMLLWTDHHAHRARSRDGSGAACSCDGSRIVPIIFREFSISCRVLCPILYLPEGDTGWLGEPPGGRRGWASLTRGASSRLRRSHLWGGRSRPAGTLRYGRLAVRHVGRLTKRVPIRVVSGRGRSLPVRNRLETGENADQATPRALDHAVVRACPDGWRRWIEQVPAVATSGGGGGGRALLISYTFPPTGGSGVQRAAKLAKYLPAFGWSVEVLSAAHERFPWKDESLMADIPPDCRVHRVPGYEPACLAQHLSAWLRRARRIMPGVLAGPDDSLLGRPIRWIEERIYWRLARIADRLGLGDGEPLWISPAVRAGLQRHRRHPFDVVISTGPPVFVHRVAMRIAHAAGLPWVAELRDPLVHDYFPVPPAYMAAMRRFEKVIVRRATRVVTTSSALAANLRARYPQRSPRDILTITNGFDREDLINGADHTHHVLDPPAECTFFTAGSFYGRNQLVQLVQPMTRVLDRHPEWLGRVRLVVGGTLDTRQQKYWQQHCPEWMTLVGYIEHASVIGSVLGACCAVLMLPECRHARQCIPGKTFELLALPTHVLALVPPGSETERIIAEAGATTTVPGQDGERVSRAIERIIEDRLAGRLNARRDWPALDRYDRRVLAGAFADCLRSV